jgi:hypothetical protein
MQPLFVGELFSNVMNARLKKMQSEIEQLTCTDVVNLNDTELSAKADKYAEKYVATDIPTVDRDALKKTGKESDGKKYWEVPFTGNKDCFTFSPSEHETGHYVDKIDGDKLQIEIEEDSVTKLEDAEKKAEKTLAVIEKCLAQMQKDADTHFSKETIKQSAEYILKKKQAGCVKLSTGGYSVS